MEKQEKQILESSKAYAEAKGLALNKDEKVLGLVISGLATNQKNNGKPYCPCRPLEGNRQKDDKKVCPCFWHLGEVKQDGHCKCRLFYAKGKQ